LAQKRRKLAGAIAAWRIMTPIERKVLTPLREQVSETRAFSRNRHTTQSITLVTHKKKNAALASQTIRTKTLSGGKPKGREYRHSRTGRTGGFGGGKEEKENAGSSV